MRKVDPRKLLVFFQGGGCCFDVTICSPRLPVVRDRVEAFDDPVHAGGVLDLGDARNPFRDHSMVFIPACTGDMHTGTRVVRYGPHRVHRKGQRQRAGGARAFHDFPDAGGPSSRAAALAASERHSMPTRCSAATRGLA